MTLKRLSAAIPASLLLALAQPHVAALAAPASSTAWPQASTDIPAAANVRFGVLPNGMRYVIAHNATPPGQASLRLRIHGGSLMETDAQQGLAHYLEHMTFNGSKHVPEGEMVKILERHGLAFGADTNAQTSWGQTVYQLDLPSTDKDTLDTSLMLLREGADQLLLDPAAIDRERGVILSEERERDTPGLHVFKSGLGFFLPDQLASRRMPIGQVSVIKAASHDLLADYYHKYYRPERAVLVAIGDFDPAAMEAKIKARFSDWKDNGPAGPEPTLGQPQQRGPDTKLLIEPGAPLSIQMEWLQSPDTSMDSQAKRERKQIEQLGLAVLNRRLQRLYRSETPPFLSAAGYKGDLIHSAEATIVSVSAQPDKWAPALTAANEEVRRLVQYGVRQDELDREIAEMRVSLQTAVAQEATRKTPQIANEIVDTLEDDDVYTDAAEDLKLFEEEVKGLKAETVNAALKESFKGSGPLVFMSSPKPVEGGVAALSQTFQLAQATPLAPPQVEEAKAWPYTNFGQAGKVVERKELADLGVTMVRFQNGVRLTVKPTRFRDSQVLVRVRIGHGLLELPSDKATPIWAANWGGFTEGGLKDLSTEQIDQVLASKIYGTQFAATDDAFLLQGATRPQDLAVQLQVLAAYSSQPGYRPEAFARLRTYASTLEAQLEATPSGVMSRDLNRLMHGNDQRFAFPDSQEIASATPEAFKAIMQQHVADGPIDIVIVGDIPMQEAIDLTASTFGALPPRQTEAVGPQARAVSLPPATAEPIVLHHKGRADQAIAYAAWPTDDFFTNPQRARTLRVLAEVMENRLLEDLREGAGVTYSPQAGASASLIFPHYGYLSAVVEIPPDKMRAFYADLIKIAADLKAKDVTADELQRAKKPLVDELQKSRDTNEYWLDQLSGAYEEPRRIDAVRTVVTSLSSVTAAEIKEAARLYLSDDKLWKLEITPEPGAAPAPA
jgi:zinc protease